MEGITAEHWVGCIGTWYWRYFGVRFWGFFFIIIITTFTTLDILPRRDVSAHFWGNWHRNGTGDMAFEGNFASDSRLEELVYIA
jgi:hypothetical protein